MWELYRKADTFKCRPSELIGVEDAYLAYCLDSAVFTFGSALKTELESVEGKNKSDISRKQERVLRKWLDLPQKFRNPGMVGPGSKDSDIEQQFVVRGRQP